MTSTEQRTIFASAARTATVTGGNQQNSQHRGLHLVINVTAITSSPSVVPTIQGYDPLSGSYYDLLIGAAITATGTTVLKVYPGLPPTPNVAACDILPPVWRVVMTHGDSDSITYSVAAGLVP